MDDLNRKRYAVYKLISYHAVFVINIAVAGMTEPTCQYYEEQYATHLIEQCYQGKLRTK